MMVGVVPTMSCDNTSRAIFLTSKHKASELNREVNKDVRHDRGDRVSGTHEWHTQRSPAQHHVHHRVSAPSE